VSPIDPALNAPVITIDGPTASGKGTVAAAVAERLGWHYLDSGAIYRALALAAGWRGIDLDDGVEALQRLAADLDLRFEGQAVWLEGRKVDAELRGETVGLAASRVGVHAAVRSALLERQRAFRRAPGLVADGRDMGTVVFPDAELKVFLLASAEARARRRHKQLIDKGFPVTLDSLLADLRDRDVRDARRAASPTRPADDAVLLDNTELSAAQTIDRVVELWQLRRGEPV
jgi:cytidylate kinase